MVKLIENKDINIIGLTHIMSPLLSFNLFMEKKKKATHSASFQFFAICTILLGFSLDV